MNASRTLLFAAPTPNSRRVAIALHELEIPHQTRVLKISEQKETAFLSVNDQAMTPVLLMGETRLRQSGAILVSLADREKRMLAPEGSERQMALEWLFHSLTDTQAASAALFFCREKVEQPDRMTASLFELRLSNFFAHANRALREAPWLAKEFSIADMALYPVVASRSASIERELPHLFDWAERMALRPGVRRGMNLESLD